MAITVEYGEPKKLAGQQSIFVRFPYKQIIVDTIRAIPERYWDGKNKVWELNYDALSFLQKILHREQFIIKGEPITDKKFGEKLIEKHYDLPKELKTKLYKYQEEDFNELMNFDKYLLLLEAGLGKAQPLYSKLLTSNGYINMGDVKIGDEVFGEDGKLHKVIGIYPQGKKSIYEVTFSDGSKCRCSDEHLWEVHTERTSHVWTLKEIMNKGLSNKTYSKKDHRYYNSWKYKIPITKPLEFSYKEVKIDPWLLGVILGDGGLSIGAIHITNTEDDIIARVRDIVEHDGLCLKGLYKEFNYSIIGGTNKNSYIPYLRELGLMGCKSETKFIPDIYKYNDTQTRLAILQGLFATDGYVQGIYLQYSTSSKQLAEDIMFLVQSLGGTCSCNEHETYYTYKGERKQGLNNFELVIKLPNNMDLVKTKKQKSQYKGIRHTGVYRNIRNIEYIGEEECRCIMVDNPSHLYITDNMIVTHNTLVTIATALKRKELGQIKHCLVICGVNTLKYNWQEEIKTHTGLSSQVLGSRRKKNGIWQTAGTKEKLEDLEHLDEFFIITNIESLRVKEIKEKIKKYIDKGEIGMMVVDEMHKTKNVSSQQGKALLLLAKHIKYFYGLTGTLIANNPLDTYLPLKCVGKELANYSQFQSRYCVWGGFGGYEVTGYKHLDELQMKLDSISKRRKKSDVLDLPPKIYTDEYLEMGVKQAKLYSDVLKAIMSDIDNVTLSLDPLGQLLRLRQVTADTSILSSTVEESVKLDRMYDIVEELAQNGRKAIVFSNWTTVTDRALERLQEFNPATITGKVKDRESEKKKFMEDDSCKVMVCTIAAAGVGLTLTAADTAIFLDEAWTFASNVQAQDRIYRIGTKSTVNIITLICRGTIDEYIHRVVKKKMVLEEALVDKKYDIRNPEVLRFILTGDGEIGC